MGTSRNDPSPNQPPWKMARAMLGRPDLEIDRQVGQVWRAAQADLGDELTSLLTSAGISAASELASKGLSPSEASSALAREAASSNDASLFLDLAERALIRTCARGGGRTDFAAEFFATATDYYVSRDLPSFVGTSGRIADAASAVNLKREIRERVAGAVRAASGASAPPTTDWSEHAGWVLEHLKGAR